MNDNTNLILRHEVGRSRSNAVKKPAPELEKYMVYVANYLKIVYPLLYGSATLLLITHVSSMCQGFKLLSNFHLYLTGYN